VLFAMFYDDFLGNMEMRRTWCSFDKSHAAGAHAPLNPPQFTSTTSLGSL
jgi:hypothetical protein